LLGGHQEVRAAYDGAGERGAGEGEVGKVEPIDDMAVGAAVDSLALERRVRRIERYLDIDSPAGHGHGHGHGHPPHLIAPGEEYAYAHERSRSRSRTHRAGARARIIVHPPRPIRRRRFKQARALAPRIRRPAP
jgi:hypothetical protein